MKKLFICIITLCSISSVVAMKRPRDTEPYPEPYYTRGAARRMQEERRRHRQHRMHNAIINNNLEEAKTLLLIDNALITKHNIRTTIEYGRPEILALFKEYDEYTDSVREGYADGFTPLSLAYAHKLQLNMQPGEKELLMQHMHQISTLAGREIGMRTDCITSTIDLADTREQVIDMIKVLDVVHLQKNLFWAMQHDNQEAQCAMLQYIQHLHDEEKQACIRSNGELCEYHEQVLLPVFMQILHDYDRLYRQQKYVKLVSIMVRIFVIHLVDEISWDEID
ncbi:MAG TPA: hypothetical protein PLU71_00565 [Candidatus Dependentiae bacterium]|nr:hypothetical protein [Candidatus Dependentiae bacterium]HRQ62331.1 hypothetical protein [Candidatus Dependentiae bacterium]